MLCWERELNTVTYKKGQIWTASVPYIDVVSRHTCTKIRPVVIFGSDEIITKTIPVFTISTNLDVPGIKIRMKNVFPGTKERLGNIVATNIQFQKMIFLEQSYFIDYVSSLPDEIIQLINDAYPYVNGLKPLRESPEWVRVMFSKKAYHNSQGARSQEVSDAYQQTLTSFNQSRFDWGGETPNGFGYYDPLWIETHTPISSVYKDPIQEAHEIEGIPESSEDSKYLSPLDDYGYLQESNKPSGKVLHREDIITPQKDMVVKGPDKEITLPNIANIKRLADDVLPLLSREEIDFIISSTYIKMKYVYGGIATATVSRWKSRVKKSGFRGNFNLHKGPFQIKFDVCDLTYEQLRSCLVMDEDLFRSFFKDHRDKDAIDSIIMSRMRVLNPDLDKLSPISASSNIIKIG